MNAEKTIKKLFNLLVTPQLFVVPPLSAVIGVFGG